MHLWTEISKLLFRTVNGVFKLTVCEVLFGVINCPYGGTENVATLNLLIFLAKWYINQCKNGERDRFFASLLKFSERKTKNFKGQFSL